MNAVKLSTPIESGLLEEPYYTHICEDCRTPLLASELEEDSATCACPPWVDDETDSAYMDCFPGILDLDSIYDASVEIRADMRLSDAELAAKYQLEGPIYDAKWLFFKPILALGSWLYWIDQETTFRRRQLEAIAQGIDCRKDIQQAMAKYVNPQDLPSVPVAVDGWVAQREEFEDNGEADVIFVGGELHNQRGKLYTEKHYDGTYESYAIVHGTRHDLVTEAVLCLDEFDVKRAQTDWEYIHSCANGHFRGEIISRHRVEPLIVKTKAILYAKEQRG